MGNWCTFPDGSAEEGAGREHFGGAGETRWIGEVVSRVGWVARDWWGWFRRGYPGEGGGSRVGIRGMRFSLGTGGVDGDWFFVDVLSLRRNP